MFRKIESFDNRFIFFIHILINASISTTKYICNQNHFGSKIKIDSVVLFNDDY